MSGRKEETVLQAAIVSAIELAFPRAVVLRMNAGTVRVKRGVMHLAPKGFPDLMVLLPRGGVAFFEIKRRDGATSPEQVDWDARLRGMGHKYALVRSPQEALNYLRRLA